MQEILNGSSDFDQILDSARKHNSEQARSVSGPCVKPFSSSRADPYTHTHADDAALIDPSQDIG